MKKNGNNVTLKAVIGTIALFLLPILVFFVLDSMVQFRTIETKWQFRQLVSNIFLFQILLSFLMLILTAYLVFTYLKAYLEIKSKFTLGILLVVVSLMTFAIASNPIIHQVLGVYGKVGLFALVPPIFATIALVILVWISSK